MRGPHHPVRGPIPSTTCEGPSRPWGARVGAVHRGGAHREVLGEEALMGPQSLGPGCYSRSLTNPQGPQGPAGP